VLFTILFVAIAAVLGAIAAPAVDAITKIFAF